MGVTGALVTELVQQGHIGLTGGRIHVTGSRPVHPMLMQALDNLAHHEGRKLKARLGSVKRAGWKEVSQVPAAAAVKYVIDRVARAADRRLRRRVAMAPSRAHNK